jgi:hypothetical protein
MTRTLWAMFVVAASMLGCGSPVDCVAAPVALLGRWSYSASETTSPTTINGTLMLEAGCPSVQGTLGGTQNDAGVVTTVSFLVTGRMLGATSVEFDATAGPAGRRHIGTIANDSIRGTWVDQTPGGISGNGVFVAVKEQTP